MKGFIRLNRVTPEGQPMGPAYVRADRIFSLTPMVLPRCTATGVQAAMAPLFFDCFVVEPVEMIEALIEQAATSAVPA